MRLRIVLFFYSLERTKIEVNNTFRIELKQEIKTISQAEKQRRVRTFSPKQ